MRTLWRKNNREKSNNAEKNERGEPLASPGIVCYAEKKQFYNSVPCVQFGTLKFRRTL